MLPTPTPGITENSRLEPKMKLKRVTFLAVTLIGRKLEILIFGLNLEIFLTQFSIWFFPAIFYLIIFGHLIPGEELSPYVEVVAADIPSVDLDELIWWRMQEATLKPSIRKISRLHQEMRN